MCGGFLIMKKDDNYFMKKALQEAKKAYLKDEIPIGAIIVKDDKIIARGHNLREASKDPTAHAEIIALKKACKKLNSWRIPGCKIYVTIEPCSMCAGAILWSRIDEVVYGSQDIKGGALGTTFNLYEQPNLNHYPMVKGGILKKECQNIIQDYFKRKRQEKNNEKRKNNGD